MKNKYQKVARHMMFVVLSLVVLSGALAVEATAETSASLSKKELKTLLTTAKTPAGHQRLAAYYRDKAQRLTAKAQEFSAQADSLATQTGTIDGKTRVARQIAQSHYRYLAKLSAQEAKDSEMLAAQHEQFTQNDQSNPAQK
jgi:hypothetical protein